MKNQEKPESIEGIFPKDQENNEINNELNKIDKFEENVSKNDLMYETNKYTYNSQQFKAIRYFGESINNGKIAISKANEKQSNLLNNILEFHYETRKYIYEDAELSFNAFKIIMFPLKLTQGKGKKIITFEMLQRLSPLMLISR